MQIALMPVSMVRQYPQFHGKMISSGCEDIDTVHRHDRRADNLVGRAIMMFRADLYPTIVAI